MRNSAQFDRQALRSLFAGVVVLILSIFVVVQVAHFDCGLTRNSGSTHCPICAAAHSAASPALTGAVVILFSVAGTVLAREVQLHSRMLVAVLFIRPPPFLS
jgi:hypothetical protein